MSYPEKGGKIEAVTEAPDSTASASCFVYSRTNLSDIQNCSKISPADQANLIEAMGLTSAEYLLGGASTLPMEGTTAAEPTPPGEQLAENLPPSPDSHATTPDKTHPVVPPIDDPNSYFNGVNFQGTGFSLTVKSGQTEKVFNFSNLGKG